MSGIPREVIKHKLGIDPSFKPIKQKERRYTLEIHETIRVEVNKLLETGFIRTVDYPSWLANPALVEKPDGFWRMCIDYTSLNKACSKYEYPCLTFARLWIPQQLLNSCRFRTRIRVIIKLASPQTTKRKHCLLRRLEFSVTPRWPSG
jgi:hypothetical protein